MISPFLVLTSAKTIFTVSTCAAVRQLSESRALAQQAGGVELALMRIADQAVFDAVERVALVEHRFVQRISTLAWVSGRVVLHYLDGAFDAGGVQMDVRIGGRSGDHAVEIVGKPGHFDQRLPAAGGAAVPIRILRRLCRSRP